MKEFTIEEADDDIRLDRWFKRHFPALGHGWVEKSLRKGLIRLDGAKAKSSDRIKAGQVIRVPGDIPTGEEIFLKPKARVSAERSVKIRDWVIYEDKDVIVINKPAGLAVQGGTGQKESVDGMLDALAEGGERPKLVHRLDKDTSGVLLLARSAKVAAALAKEFARKEVEKIYWALAIGAPSEDEGVIDLPLAKLVKGGSSRTLAMDEGYEQVEVEEMGKRAITQWRIVERMAQRLCWLELTPITGRTHQLRVHLAAIGHPIVGDGKYGGRDAFVQGIDLSKKLHLHAHRVTLKLGNRKIDVKAPLPKHMRESWNSLGLSG